MWCHCQNIRGALFDLRRRHRWQKCAESAILRGWVTLRLNFRLKGYISRQYLWTVRWGNGCTTTLPLEFFTQRNVLADFVRKKQKNAFQSPSEGLRDNVRIPSIPRWKARVQLPIRHDWTFFAISYVCDVISRNLSKWAFYQGMVYFEQKFLTEEASPTNHCCMMWENYSDCPFVWYKNIHSALFGFVTKHACDRQTNRQTELRLPRLPSHMFAR